LNLFDRSAVAAVARRQRPTKIARIACRPGKTFSAGDWFDESAGRPRGQIAIGSKPVLPRRVSVDAEPRHGALAAIGQATTTH